MLNLEKIEFDDYAYYQIIQIEEFNAILNKHSSHDTDIINNRNIDSFIKEGLTDFAYLNNKIRYLSENIASISLFEVIDESLKAIDKSLKLQEATKEEITSMEYNLEALVDKMVVTRDSLSLKERTRLITRIRLQCDKIIANLKEIIKKIFKINLENKANDVYSNHHQGLNLLKNLSKTGEVSELILRNFCSHKTILEIIDKTKAEEKEAMRIFADNHTDELLKERLKSSLPNSFFIKLMRGFIKNMVLYTVFKVMSFYFNKVDKKVFSETLLPNNYLNFDVVFKNFSCDAITNFYRMDLNRTLNLIADFAKKYNSTEKIEDEVFQITKDNIQDLKTIIMDSNIIIRDSYTVKGKNGDVRIIKNISEIIPDKGNNGSW
jgi:hypothetical protein